MSCYLVVLSVDIAVDPALLWELSSFSQLLPNQNTELPAKGREDLCFGYHLPQRQHSAP